jgi:hypothetical protein
MIAALVGSMTASAEAYDRSTIDLGLPNGAASASLLPGDMITLSLPRRVFIHKLMLQVESSRGNAAAEVIVNGDRKANTWLTTTDPLWTATVEAESSTIQIAALQALSGPQGYFVIRRVRAVVSDTDYPGSPGAFPASRCVDCADFHFPLYYHSPLANLSNRAIILVDRLAEYTNYADYGNYLLPVKKAAAEARALAEARTDSSSYARPYFFELLRQLDNCETYLRDTFERGAAFELGTQLLGLREQIRSNLN